MAVHDPRPYLDGHAPPPGVAAISPRATAQRCQRVEQEGPRLRRLRLLLRDAEKTAGGRIPRASVRLEFIVDRIRTGRTATVRRPAPRPRLRRHPHLCF